MEANLSTKKEQNNFWQNLNLKAELKIFLIFKESPDSLMHVTRSFFPKTFFSSMDSLSLVCCNFPDVSNNISKPNNFNRLYFLLTYILILVVPLLIMFLYS